MYRTLIPNMLTSSNLVFGMCSIISTFNGNFFVAAVCIILAMIADGLDGRVARFFGVSSDFGREMDSLCDLVSFGVAPAMLIYVFYLHVFGYFGWVAAIMFALCGALRLARFNVNTDVVHGYFMGLPIPAGGCLISTFIMLCIVVPVDLNNLGFLVPLAVMVVGYLMVSKVRYPDFKGKGEKSHVLSLILSAAVGIAVLIVGKNAIFNAILFDIFITYAVFGILNTTVSLFSTAGETDNI